MKCHAWFHLYSWKESKEKIIQTHQQTTFHTVVRSANHSRGGGGNLPWSWVRMCGWSPRTPPYSNTKLSEKHDPFIYFLSQKDTPFIHYFLKDTPFIYYFIDFTYSYTFWAKKIPHWYTFEVKMITIHILGGLKSIPHSSRTSVYTFIMEVNPPPRVTTRQTNLTNSIEKSCLYFPI